MVVFIMGPTGVGKSKLAMRVARETGGEIVSVDSALVYIGLDIGTAKPNRIERQSIPHHLVDICMPAENYSAGRFVVDAGNAIKKIEEKGRVPILVGGTNLYFRALEYGLSELPKSEPEIRKMLEMAVAKEGLSSLYKRLSTIDPVAACAIKPSDAQRIMRALEVYEIAGRPISTFWLEGRNAGLARQPHKFIILPDSRAEL
jgi:tRNA dimethylallyltransferase